MTKRDKDLLTALLDALCEWSGPLDEAILHMQMEVQPPVIAPITVAEFRHALKVADAEGWIEQVESKRRGALWFITNKGKAERLS